MDAFSAQDQLEFFKEFSTRQGLTVIGADDPDKKLIGWIVKEFIGINILKNNEVITIKENLLVDDVVTTENDGRGTIYQEDGELYIDFGGTFGLLEFDQDSRHCWVCSAFINKNCKKFIFDALNNIKPCTE